MGPLLLSRDEVRSLDRQAIEDYGIPGVVLMENAGRSVAELLLSLGNAGRVSICCGKGNNGGDGFVVARHLDNAGVAVRVFLFSSPDELSPDAAINYQVIAKAQMPIIRFSDTSFDQDRLQQSLRDADWIVDALFGTGLKGAARSPFDQIITAVNASGARILAVDIPSGLDCDTGQPMGSTIRALHTATFVASKKGFSNPRSKEYLGEVHVLSIGMPRDLLHRFQLSLGRGQPGDRS